MLKPVQGESSSNVICVGDEHELLEAFGAPPLADRPVDHAILAEEYLTDPPDPERTIAPYVSVESLVIDGRSVPLALSGRFPLAEPFRETGDFMPHPLETEEAETVVAVAIAAAEALGVRSGALHTEIKLTADGPKVIEVNGRVAGGGINAVYAERNGVSIRHLAASVALACRSIRPVRRRAVRRAVHLPALRAAAGLGDGSRVDRTDRRADRPRRHRFGHREPLPRRCPRLARRQPGVRAASRRDRRRPGGTRRSAGDDLRTDRDHVRIVAPGPRRRQICFMTNRS